MLPLSKCIWSDYWRAGGEKGGEGEGGGKKGGRGKGKGGGFIYKPQAQITFSQMAALRLKADFRSLRGRYNLAGAEGSPEGGPHREK